MRYKQLDSLRGLAALSVLFYHYLIVSDIFLKDTFNDPHNSFINIVKYSPLHILWAGPEAIVFFFVLSGFVLSLKFYKNKRVSYRSFLLSRFFRIYIPCYVAILIAFLLDIFISRHGIKGLSSWFNSIWVSPITWGLIINHILLIRYFGYGQVIPVLWSLVMEIRISIIFPLLMVLIKKLDWKINLLLGYGLSLFYYVISNNGTRQEIYSIPSDYFYTLSFIIMFFIGALLAKHREEIIVIFKRLSFKKKFLLLLLAVLLYTINYWLFPYARIDINHFISDMSVSAGVAIFIVLAMTTRISLFLEHSFVHFLGKISYSIYLYHAVVLLAFIYLFYSVIPIYIIWVLGIISTIGISYFSYKYVEQPAIKLGASIIKTKYIKR